MSRRDAAILFAWLAACGTAEVIRDVLSGINYGFN